MMNQEVKEMVDMAADRILSKVRYYNRMRAKETREKETRCELGAMAGLLKHMGIEVDFDWDLNLNCITSATLTYNDYCTTVYA